MHLLVLLLVVFVAIPASAAERRTTLDEAAHDYVHLALEIGAHEKGYIDAYFGPPEWRIEAEAHPRNISELKAEAVASKPSWAQWISAHNNQWSAAAMPGSRQTSRARGRAST